MVSLYVPRWPTVYSVNCLNYILCDMQIWTICSTRNLSQTCAEELPLKSLEKPYSTALVLWGSIFGIYFEASWYQLVSYVYGCKTDPRFVISLHQKCRWKSKSAISAREEQSAQLVCVCKQVLVAIKDCSWVLWNVKRWQTKPYLSLRHHNDGTEIVHRKWLTSGLKPQL